MKFDVLIVYAYVYVIVLFVCYCFVLLAKGHFCACRIGGGVRGRSIWKNRLAPGSFARNLANRGTMIS